MNGAFSIALSSLQGNQDAISATGQNLANLNTTGYKGNFVEFRDLVAQSASALPGSQQGLGVTKPIVQTIFSDGGIQSSASSYAAAIQGDGFFVVSDASGKQLYTRDGDFTVDKDGYLKTQSGENIMGWNEVNGVLDTKGSQPVPVKLAGNATAPPVAATSMSFTANLNAASTASSGTAELTVPIQAVDSLGATHTLSVVFTKTATPGSWNYSVSIPASDLSTGTGVLSTGTLKFAADGTLASRVDTTSGTTTYATTATAGFNPVPVSVSNLKNGANNMSVNWSLLNTDGSGMLTQFSQSSAYSNPQQNGVTAGQITKIGMSVDGQISASFSNGQTRSVSQVALAKFVNNDSLIGVGNNNLSASVLSSPPSIGTAGTKGLGKVIAGALEGSNVDVATQFTNLITYQRGYQASSKVITTADQMLQEVMDIIR